MAAIVINDAEQHNLRSHPGRPGAEHKSGSKAKSNENLINFTRMCLCKRCVPAAAALGQPELFDVGCNWLSVCCEEMTVNCTVPCRVISGFFQMKQNNTHHFGQRTVAPVSSGSAVPCSERWPRSKPPNWGVFCESKEGKNTLIRETDGRLSGSARLVIVLSSIARRALWCAVRPLAVKGYRYGWGVYMYTRSVAS